MNTDRHLPPRQWTALILHDVLDWPDTDAAALLGCSVPALRATLGQAHRRLDDGGRVPDLTGPGGEIDMHRVGTLLREHAPPPLVG